MCEPGPPALSAPRAAIGPCANKDGCNVGGSGPRAGADIDRGASSFSSFLMAISDEPDFCEAESTLVFSEEAFGLESFLGAAESLP